MHPRLWHALLAIAVCVPAVAGARAVAEGWVPLGDDAVVATKAHDVLSTRSPFVGMPTTLGGDAHDAHHPGPLEFWVLAAPERAAGSAPWGIVAGVVLVGVAAMGAVAWCARRAAGRGAAIAVLAVLVACCFALGRQVIADPWNPYVAILPLATACVAAWAVAAGERWALPVLALAASFTAQAHVLYVPLALVLLGGAVVVTVADRRPDRAGPLLATAGVLAVAWSLPVWEQLTGDPGNLTLLVRVAGDDAGAVGWRYALRAVARAVGFPPLFATPAGSVGPFTAPLGGGAAVGALTFTTVLAAGTVRAAVRSDRVGLAAASVATAALVTAAVTVARVPVTVPDVPRYRLLLLWPVGAFAWFAAGFALARIVPASRRPRPVVIAAVVVAAVVIVAAPAAVGLSRSHERDDSRVASAVTIIARRVAPALEDRGPVRVDVHGEISSLVTYGVVRELRRRDVDARVAPADRYLGDAHAASADAPTLLVVGRRDPVPPRARLLARYALATRADQVEMARLEAGVRRRIVRALTGRLGDDPVVRAIASRRADVATLTRDGSLVRLQAQGALALDHADVAALRRFEAARFVVEDLTLTAYLVP